MKIARLQSLLPPGFSLTEKGKAVLVVRRGWEEILLPLGEKTREEMVSSSDGAEFLCGRGRPLVLEIRKKRVVVRRYRHGGLFRLLTGELLSGGERPLRELGALERARAAGIPVTPALGVFLYPYLAGALRADLVTEYIPDAVDLLSRLSARGADGAGTDGMIRAAARLVSRAHQDGLFHADLNLKNILIRQTDAGPEGYLLDLDRSFFRPRLSRAEKERNLLRLYRSYLKMTYPEVADPRPALRFLLAYAPRDRDWRRFLLRRAGRSGGMVHRWRWGWGERVFGSRYARPGD